MLGKGLKVLNDSIIKSHNNNLYKLIIYYFKMALILATKNPAEFRTRQVKVQYKNNSLNMSPVGEEMNFQEMGKKRQPVNPDKIYDNIMGEGHVLANLGIGGFLTISIDKRTYLLGCKQERVEFKDTLFNPIGGYLESKHLIDPAIALDNEIAEELLPVKADERLVRFRSGEIDLPRPYEDIFQSSLMRFALTNPSSYEPRNLRHDLTLDERVLEGLPGLVFEAARNTAKLFFNYHIETNTFDFESAGLSMAHAEDKFDPATKSLRVEMYPGKIYLIPVENTRLVDEVYFMENGRLVPISSKEHSTLKLSEAFSADERGFSTSDITLRDFLLRQ